MGRRLAVLFASGIKIFGGVALLWTGVIPVWANPTGEVVVGGAAAFNRPDAATLIVNQQTDRAVINWNNFSIANGELTRFVQPNSTSAALNRVVTLTPSLIEGALQANGTVLLSNPNGIMVGKGGTINVGSFVASTHDIQPEDFMKGQDLLFKGSSEASILNQGKITAREGDVFLVAREVKNEGQIMAKDGTVGMVSGTEVSLVAQGQKNYKVRLLAAEKTDRNSEVGNRNSEKDAEIVNEGVIQAANAVLEATGSYLPMAIKNTGVIQATGIIHNADGTVTLTGGKGDVLNTGVVAALQRSLDGQKEQGGSVLMAGKNVTSELGSIVTASGKDGGGAVKLRAEVNTILRGSIEVVGVSEEAKGGQVQLLGNNVGVLDRANVNASGGAGGGEVLVGGDYLGRNPSVPNAQAVVMAPSADIRADATAKGNGGKVILWSDDYTAFFGGITALGGPNGGDGGFVETSSANNLQAFGWVDASAAQGQAGQWLLDPRNVTITSATAGGAFTGGNPDIFIPTGNDATILNTQINGALDRGTSVTITTGTTGAQAGNITVSAPITRSKPSTEGAGQVTLTFEAANDITIGSSIQSSSGSLAMAFYADVDGSGGGTFTLNSNLITLGGDVLISAAGLNYLSGGINTTAALNGAVTQTIAGDITIRPSTAGVTIGINGGAGTFAVSQPFLNNLNVAGLALPGTVTIGSRSAGNLTVGANTSFNNNGENLKLVTGGNLLGPVGVNAVTMGDGILILSAAGSIFDAAGTGSFLFTGTRVAAILEGNALRLSSFSTLDQISVTTDGTVATQNVRDNQGGTQNLNWSVLETTNSSGGGGNTTINGISVRTNSVAISYENTLGNIIIAGGGVSSLSMRTTGVPPAESTFTIPGSSTGNNASGSFLANGLTTIVNPGTGYSAAPTTMTVTLSGGGGTTNLTLGRTTMSTNASGMAGIGSLNVQAANNPVGPAAFRDFTLSAPQGTITTSVPIFSGGGNLTLRANDVIMPGVSSGSLTLTDRAGQELPSVRYANLGVLNTFQAVPEGDAYAGYSFGTRVPLLPDEVAAGAIRGAGGVLILEPTSPSAEGQPVAISPGDTAGTFSLNLFQLPLLEAPGIRIGGPKSGNISIDSILAVSGTIEKQTVTTRGATADTDTTYDYDPRYFENPFFRGTQAGVAPLNVNNTASFPHVLDGTVSLVSGLGYVRNVRGGDVHVSALSMTAVNDVFFDARSSDGTYPQLGTTQANGSVIGAISARSGRTVPEADVTIGNGGDVTLNLNYTTGYVNDSRLVFPSQEATATAGVNPGGEVNLIDINTAAGEGGMLYTSTPVVSITGGGVQEASARAILSGDGVALIAPQIVGQGYTPSTLNGSGTLTGPTVTLSGGGANASGATIGNGGMAFISDNRIISVFNVTNGGSGYNDSAPPQVIIRGGGPNGGEPSRPAVARAVVQNGVVTSLVVVDPGAGYTTSNPAADIIITVQSPSSGGARAVAVVDGDFRPSLFGNSLTPIYVSSAGSGYTVEPTVTISGGGVKQAQARAVVQLDPFSNNYGKVVGFEITESGLGYTSAPTVTIGSGQAFGNFGEYGISTETVDRNVGSGNISISNVPYNVVSRSFVINAPIRTGDALGVPGGDAISGSVLLNIAGYITANDNNASTGLVANPGGARGIIMTGDASLIPEFGAIGNVRSGSVTILAQGIKNGTTAASTLYTLSGSEGFPIQIGTATGGISNIAGSLNVGLLARLAGTPEVGDLQIYAPAPGQVQQALGNVPLDPNHRQEPPRSSNDLFLSGLSTPEETTDAGGNTIQDESLVTVEVGAYEGKLTLLRRAESQATAVVVNNRVTLILPEQGGALFGGPPTVIVTGGGVTPASASVFVSNGTLVAPNGTSKLTVGNGIDDPGQGYFTVPTVTFTGGGGSGAEGVAIIDGTGRLTGIQITNPGFGYTTLPTVVISSPTGVQAAATATVANQTITQTTLTVANGGITAPGVGYSSNPLVVVTGGRTGQATATATVDTNPNSSTYSQITAINISLNGDSFPSGTAAIFIAPPTGAAQATANLQGGVVTSFTITDAGGGYSSIPSVLLTTGTGTTPYTLAGDRVGLIADRLKIFDAATPANVLFEAGLVALSPYTNQRPVSLGVDTLGATSLLLPDLQRFLAEELVVGRRNAAYIGVGAGEITIQTVLSSDNLRVSDGLFLAGTRGLSDVGGTSGISFPAVSVNVGSTVSLTGTGNALRYFSGVIQGPFDELTYRKPMEISSALRSTAALVQLPLTISEIFGNPAYFTGQRFNQGITTQNGNVRINADLFEQTRLVGYIDTTGGGKYPVSSAPNNSVNSLSDYATVTLAPKTANRPISVYATTPGSGLALRIGNPRALGLEQIKAGTLEIGNNASGTITLNSDLGFNYLQYPNAPRGLILSSSAGGIVTGTSQVPPSPNPVPTPSVIRVANLTINSTGSVVLNGNNEVGILNAPSVSGNLTFYNRSGAELTLGTINVGGDFVLNSNGDLSQIQTGSGVDVAGKTSLTTSGTIILDQPANQFTGEVSAINNNGGISIRNSLATVLGNIVAGGTAQAVTLVSGGGVTQTDGTAIQGGTLAVPAVMGALSVTLPGGSNLVLGNSGNRFTSVTLAASGGGNLNNVTLANTGGLNLAALTINGNLSLTGAGISQTGIWIVPGTTSLTAGAANNINLGGFANNFGQAVSVISAKDLSLNDLSDLILGTSTISGATTVTTGGTISQTGAITAINGNSTYTVTAGSILLGTQANNFANQVVTLNAVDGSDVSFRNIAANAVYPTLGAPNLDDLTIIFNNAPVAIPGRTLTGNLSITAGGAITQTGGGMVVEGNTILQTGSDKNITFELSNNFQGPLSVVSGNTVRLDNGTNALNLGASTISGDLIIDSAGAVTDSGAITVGLNSNFGSEVALTSLTLDGGASFGGRIRVNVNGNLTITGATSNLLFDGNLATDALDAVTVTGSINLANTRGSITLPLAGSTATASQLSAISTPGTFLFRNTAGGFQMNEAGAAPANAFNLTQTILDRFSASTLALEAATGDITIGVGGFNVPTVGSLSLTTETGNITAGGAIQTGTLTFSSAGTVAFASGNRIQNFGRALVTTGGFAFENLQGLNLTGTVTTLNGGNATLTVAGQFYNVSGIALPFDNVGGVAQITSLSMFGGMPTQISALANFRNGYYFQNPGGNRRMIYAVAPYTMFAPGGTVIAGIDLSGSNTGGAQFDTFRTGANNLNWMIADFGKFNLPKVRRAQMEYMLYPQRVEPETRSLPTPVMAQLSRDLGRPPTLEEIQRREVSNRAAARMRTGAILERSSFDGPAMEAQESAQGPTEAMDGGIPQAQNSPKVQDTPHAGKPNDAQGDAVRPILRSKPQKAVALRGEPLDPAMVIENERERAELHEAPPVAGR